jgi:hypothetical protein
MTISVLDDIEPADVEKFLRMLQGHQGELTAALAVGWTPRQLRVLKRDPEFSALVSDVNTQRIENIERKVFKLADKGVRWASELVLFCHAADRGWRPPAQRHEVSHSGQVDHVLVASVKEAVRESLSTRTVAELQAAPFIDAEESRADSRGT